MSSATPEFLSVRPGDYVAIKNEENCEYIKVKNKNYWVGKAVSYTHLTLPTTPYV